MKVGKLYAIRGSVSLEQPQWVRPGSWENRGEMKGPAVWPNCTSFRIFLLIMEGLSLADRRLEYYLGVRGSWKPILNP